MKIPLSLLFVVLVSVFNLFAFIGDKDPFLNLLKKLEEMSKKNAIEKVYIHLDKPYYAVGDDIWFKAYVTEGQTSAPTTASGIIYVELINESDSLIKLLKLPLLGGLANGDFKLNSEISEGNYRIRAYTQWMRNAGPEYFFDKVIKVGNSWANIVFTSADYQDTGGGNIKASLKFTDKDSRPYTSAKIAYEIRFQDKSLLKGQATTDATGHAILNFSDKLLHQKQGLIVAKLTVDGQNVTKTIPVKLRSAEIDIQFFPEGGNLIENLPCKIGVKAVNSNGLGENIKGTIVDNERNEVLTFETLYLGMGSFILTPEEGKTYKARIKQANGMEKVSELPKSQKSGYSLTVNNSDTAKLVIKVMLSPDLLNKGELNLLAQHHGNVLFTSKITTDKQISTFTVPKGKLPSGIGQLTLFDSLGIPVSERIIFINNLMHRITLTDSGRKATYSKKENISFTLKAVNKNAPVLGSFSIAVTNADIVEPDLDNESNILSGLLLRPDLRGYIERPNHYFLNDNKKTREELDNLMLTQGWRKIDWQAVQNSSLPDNPFPLERYMSISGVVTMNNKRPVNTGNIALLSSSKVKLAATTQTDEMGHFSFDEVSFGDSVSFVIQATTKEGKKDLNLKLDKVPEQPVTTNNNRRDFEVNVNNSMVKYLRESERFFDDQFKHGFLNKPNWLKTVNIVGQKPKKEDSASVNSSNYNGRGHADKIITAKDLENVESLSVYFAQGRIMGVADSAGYPYSTRLPHGISVSIEEPPPVPKLAVSVDGLIVKDFSLADFPVTEIESVEVLLSSSYLAIYGSTVSNGLLIITTKRGGNRKTSDIYAPGIVTFSPKGYDVSRQFYSPKYEANADTKPDLRTTVFWEPNLITDAMGNTKINYYNPDRAGNYRMIIEGIDANGNLARQVLTYEVK